MRAVGKASDTGSSSDDDLMVQIDAAAFMTGTPAILSTNQIYNGIAGNNSFKDIANYNFSQLFPPPPISIDDVFFVGKTEWDGVNQ